MKADPLLWLECRFLGYQTLYGVPLVMCRECRRCTATLGLRMSTLAEMYPLVSVGMDELIGEYVNKGDA
jgi:hypothetical protein